MSIYNRLNYSTSIKSNDIRYLTIDDSNSIVSDFDNRTLNLSGLIKEIENDIDNLQLNSGLWNYYDDAIHSSGIAPVITSGYIQATITDSNNNGVAYPLKIIHRIT